MLFRSFLLNVQGHILADALVLRLDQESFLLDCEPQAFETIWQQLDRHIIADVVELEDWRERLACFSIEGPLARVALEKALGAALPAMRAFDHVYLNEMEVRVVRATVCGGDGYRVFAPPQRAAKLCEKVLTPSSGVAANVTAAGFEALEICRIENGVPRYGVDITEKNLAQETGQMHAVSFSKGCYIGQEVVERIRSQGHVNRKLVRLLFEGRQEIAPGLQIQIERQTVGATGSSAYSFAMEKTVALGYLRREYAEAGKRVMVGTVAAEVGELPVISVLG